MGLHAGGYTWDMERGPLPGLIHVRVSVSYQNPPCHVPHQIDAVPDRIELQRLADRDDTIAAPAADQTREPAAFRLVETEMGQRLDRAGNQGGNVFHLRGDPVGQKPTAVAATQGRNGILDAIDVLRKYEDQQEQW